MFRLCNAISQKRRGNCHWVFGFFTTMRQFTSHLLHSKLFTTVFLQLNHPAYSPDMAPSNCYLFRNLKSHLHGTRFADDELLKLLLKRGLKGRTKNSLFSRHKQLTRKVVKCTDIRRDYGKNGRKFVVIFCTEVVKCFELPCRSLRSVQPTVPCHLTKIPVNLFSGMSSLERLDLSNNFLHNPDFDLRNCTKLNILNFSNNNIEHFGTESTKQLNELVMRKPEGNTLLVDLSYNTLHCLCNSTSGFNVHQHTVT